MMESHIIDIDLPYAVETVEVEQIPNWLHRNDCANLHEWLKSTGC